MVDLTDPYDVNETLKEKDRRIYVLEAQVARLTAALEQHAATRERIVDLEGNLAFLAAALEQHAVTIAAARALHANIENDENDDVDAYWALVSDLGAALAPSVQAEEE